MTLKRGPSCPEARAHPGSGRPGIVLFATVLLVTVLAVTLAAGACLALRGLVVARARSDALRARMAAESTVRTTVALWRASDARALPALGRRTLPDPLRLPGDAQGGASVRRLGGDLFLVIGSARAGVARARAGALVRVLSPTSFLPSFPGGLTADRARLGPSAALGTAGGYAAPPAWPPTACDPAARDSIALVFGSAALPGIVAGDVAIATGATLDGDPPEVERAVPPDTAGFGPLPWAQLARWADRVETGTVFATPTAAGGACARTAPGNWGAPLDPDSPCADYLPLIFAPGDLRVLGGSGQGVLVVRGRLSLEGDARFYGPVLVAGDIDAAEGVELWGAVRARTADWRGALHASPCVVLRALAAAPGLSRPLRAGARFWVPVF